MTRSRTSLLQTLSLVFAFALLLSSANAAPRRKKKSADEPPKKAVVLFNLDMAEGVQNPLGLNASEEASRAVYSRLMLLPEVYVARFNKRNPSIQCAIGEASVRADSVEAPFNEDDGEARRSVVLGRLLGADMAVSGSIAGYSYDENTRTVTLTLVVDVLNVADNRVLNSAAGTTKVTANEGEMESATFLRAVGQAADTLLEQVRGTLTGQPTIRPTNPTDTPNPTIPATPTDGNNVLPADPTVPDEPTGPTTPSDVPADNGDTEPAPADPVPADPNEPSDPATPEPPEAASPLVSSVV